MSEDNRRRYERVEAQIKVKLPGDRVWSECSVTTGNVSGGGLLFESARELTVGDVISLQFMLHAAPGTLSNTHFFATAKVVRVVPKESVFQIAVELVIAEEVRKEILSIVERIKSQNLRIERPTIREVLHKQKPEGED